MILLYRFKSKLSKNVRLYNLNLCHDDSLKYPIKEETHT